MRKYAIVIRKFERRLNIAISDFPEIGVYGFEEDFENKEEDDDSKLAVYGPWSSERTEDAKMKTRTERTKMMITITEVYTDDSLEKEAGSSYNSPEEAAEDMVAE